MPAKFSSASTRAAFASLMSLIDRQLPQGLFEHPNPVFDYELRHMGWPRNAKDLKRFTILVTSSISLLSAILWLFNRHALGFILLTTLGVSVLSDLYYALLTINRLNHLFVSGMWDDLRLTLLPQEDILLGLYAALQIRAWRLAVTETAFRTASCVVIVIALWEQIPSLPHFMITLFIAFLMVRALLPTLIFLEPLWRMCTLLVVSMAISVRIHNWMFGALAAFATILGIHLLQIAIIPLFVILCQIPPLRRLVFADFIRRFYTKLHDYAWQKVVHYAFQSE